MKEGNVSINIPDEQVGVSKETTQNATKPPVLTKKQSIGQQLAVQALQMSNTDWNIIQFENKPSIWFQYYTGILLGLPTVIIIKKSEADWIPALKKSDLVKAVFEVHTFLGHEVGDLQKKVNNFIKKHPYTK